ncbi:MFS transporter [Enemella sp. A6]|uniref:MFS transporter n=1 Tax=Enemella sp. A6 TaxID=3440152 RepID=UPI003EB9B527
MTHRIDTTVTGAETTATDRPRGGLAALCIAVTTSWGLLFYSLPVAVAPMSAESGWSQTAITGALTAGMIVAALAGIRVGRMLDHRGPRLVMTGGAVIGVLAMLVVAWSPNLIVFYLAWVLAGLAQSAVLYTPAFAVITRWYGPRRVPPLTTLTLVAGLASTIYAPIVAFLVDRFGWRMSYLIIAAILAVVTVPLHALFLNRTWTAQPQQSDSPEVSGRAVRAVTRSPRFLVLQLAMSLATFTLMAVTINIIPLLLEGNVTYALAALALGLLGAGQVVGRIAYPSLAARTSPRTRTAVLLGAGAVSLWGLALTPGPVWLLIAVAIFAGAARGCHTLLQATAVSDRWGTENFGAINGVFSAPMTFVGALAPVAGPALAGWLGGFAKMAIVMSALLTVAVVLAAGENRARAG